MNSNDDFLNMGSVIVGYGQNPIIHGYGTLWPLGRVLYVPDALHNSISLRQLTKHSLSIKFLDDAATVNECTKGKTIMTATTYRSHFYRITFERDICSTLGYNTLFSQDLPSRSHPTQCHMTRVLSDISNTTHILHDPLPTTNELIIDSGCSDHMFSTNVQMTNYQVLHKGNKHVQVANGQSIPVLGVGECGILKKVYYVPDLSHRLLSVRGLTDEGYHCIRKR